MISEQNTEHNRRLMSNADMQETIRQCRLWAEQNFCLPVIRRLSAHLKAGMDPARDICAAEMQRIHDDRMCFDSWGAVGAYYHKRVLQRYNDIKAGRA